MLQEQQHNAAPPSRPTGSKAGGGGGVTQGGSLPGVEMLTGMGFSRQQAEAALRAAGGDLERAANWLLTRP